MKTVQRIGSIDVLRGFVMFSMIFVNCGFFKAPWWVGHHTPNSDGNGITYTDVIFPAFLFLAGVAIPLAFQRYSSTFKDQSTALFHILYRGVSLMVMGFLFVNTSFHKSMGFTATFWTLIAMLIIMFTWLQYKGESKIGKYITNSLRIVGVAGLIGYFFYYTGAYGQPLQAYWFGILGLIGRAYIIASVMYMIIGKRTELLMFGVLVLSMLHVVSYLGGVSGWWWLSGGDRVAIAAGQASITLLGVVVGAKILQLQAQDFDISARHKELVKFICMFAILGIATSIILESEFGIHKNGSLPAYVYATVSITMLMWLVVYYLCDIKQKNNFVTRFFLQVGTVPLTAYVMAVVVTRLGQLIKVSDSMHLYDLLFKSLGPWLDKLGAPLWCVQVAGALQTIFFCIVVAGFCVWLKKKKIFLKI